MNTSDQETSQEWIDGSQYLAIELANRFNVPKDEINSFQPFIRVYPKGATLIFEEEIDKSLFLLRFGKLAVFKNVSGQQTQIGTIEAVNFVGEMSLINAERRSATIKALSDQVLVYCFAKPNLSLILSNAKWAELLVSRLAKDLAQSNKQLAETHQKIEQQKNEVSALQALIEKQKNSHQQFLINAEQAFNAILHFQNTTREKAVVGSKGWAYLMALSELSQALIRHYLPDLQLSGAKADKQVMQKCLTEVRKTGQTGVFDDFDV